MVNLTRPDPHVDGPEPRAGASATASASASASAGVLLGNWRSLADRLRCRVERGPWGLLSLAGGGRRESPLRVEEYAEQNARVVRVELPGIDPDNDIEISVSGGLLHIRVERRETAALKQSYRSSSATARRPVPSRCQRARAVKTSAPSTGTAFCSSVYRSGSSRRRASGSPSVVARR